MVIASTLYSINTVCMKVVQDKGTIGSFEFITIQSVWVCFLCWLYTVFFEKDVKIYYLDPSERWPMFWRSVFGYIGLVGLYVALEFTSLTKSTVLFWSMPVFTALYARCFLKETLTSYDWVALILAFAGMVLL